MFVIHKAIIVQIYVEFQIELLYSAKNILQVRITLINFINSCHHIIYFYQFLIFPFSQQQINAVTF